MASSKYWLLLLFSIVGFSLSAQHPHILVNDSDKQSIIQKTKEQAWAKKVLEDLRTKVTPYVERHSTDPQWILSRYQMNRVPGKYYTTVYSDESGSRLVKWEGNAPVPTVRVSTHLRSPITEKGAPYRQPEIDELVPNDTCRFMFLYNEETGKKEWVDPQTFIAGINGEINSLALDAAILYWLEGDSRYARFASDILDQWARGVFYQQPIVGPCRTGLLDIQTLGDANYRPAILAYDFVKPYMQQNGYDLHWYDTVFEKFASTLAFRGFWNNNWYAAESSTMVFATLNLEDKQKQDYYLQYILSKDTINGACGQLALPSTVDRWLTPDGHWKEPGGYHNYPVGNLLVASLALEKNGYDIFRRFPALFRASYAMLKYSFPDLTSAGFGDTGRSFQSAESLEIGIIGAIKYNEPVLPDMLASMNKLIAGGKYQREKSGFLGLLCFLPQLPGTNSTYRWSRSGTLDFARYFLQRNGTDPQTGLMIGVQGATYNHNHCNGMAMELYGLGEVLGIDAGTGPNYEHPLHRNYYSQWAAHNTVVAGGMSSSVPFSGAAGSKNIGQIELAAMEPMPDREAVSPLHSFTDTRYRDKSTNTSQSRTLAIVRTSDSTGYYVDIFRSDNGTSNDYVYHNIGEEITFVNENRETLPTVDCSYPLIDKDYPGFRFFRDVKKLDGYAKNLAAVFRFKNEQSEDLFLQALVPGSEGRSYFMAKTLKTKTSGKQYEGKMLPVFTMHDNGESRSRPFIAVFEPYKGKEGNSVVRIESEKVKDPGSFTALTVFNMNESFQEILQSVNPGKEYSTGSGSLRGYFGIAGIKKDQVNSLYLGKGTFIRNRGYSILSKSAEGSASLLIEAGNLKVSCNQPVEIGIPGNAPMKMTLLNGQDKKELKFRKSGNQILVEVPAVYNGIINIE